MSDNFEQMTLFDFMEDGEKYKPIKSTDWKWKFSDYPKEKNGIKVFSCFACGGGSTMGYKLAGCDVIGCCEIDKQMNDIYVQNHHPKYNFLMDIRDFNKLRDDAIPGELFDLDVLDGSPPCTTFSTAGEREESWGKKKKFREGQAEQTLDDLSFIFVETVKKLKPKVVIMENVEGLLLGDAWKYVQGIYKGFTEAGYNVKHWLLKGENMGVPQKRHRVFFIAARNDMTVNIRNIDLSFNYEPITFGQIKTLHGDAFDGIYYELLKKAISTDNSIADIRKRLGLKPSGFNEHIVRDFEVLPTIRATSPIAYRVPECTKTTKQDIISAQTFPQDFDFGDNASKSRIGYVCGMSVPPVMIKRIVTRLIDQGVFDYKKGAKNEDSN